MSALISAFLGIFLGGSDKTLPPAPTPSLLQLLALSCFAVFIGAVFVLIGLFVGSSLTKRSIPLITFFALYYLTPLLGKWDPRQWITASGDSVIHYIGAFRIPATENNLLASVLLLLLTVLSLSGFFTIWHFRRKLPTQGVTCLREIHFKDALYVRGVTRIWRRRFPFANAWSSEAYS